MTVPEPTPLRPAKRRPWLDRVGEALSFCLEPHGDIPPRIWEYRHARPADNEYETELILVAPALSRIETDDPNDAREVFNKIDCIDVAELARLLGRRGHLQVSRTEDEGLLVEGGGRLLGREATVIIHCDQPFEDARPRRVVDPKTLSWYDLDDEDDDAR